MFTKTIIALCASLVLTTAYVSVAAAQSDHRQTVKPYTEFEKLWFTIPNPSNED